MFITPIETMDGIRGLSGLAGLDGAQAGASRRAAGSNIFRDIFADAIKNAGDADKNLAEKQYLLSTGQIDDAHTVPVAAAQAEMSLNLLVQLRNKALDAYNELMRLNL